MTIPSDEILAAASASGDHEAFDRLASRYGSELDGYFRRRLPDDGRVEELRQETLLALLSLLPSYRERGRFRSLVFSIAYRKLVSARRAERPSLALTEDLPARPEDPAVLDVRRAFDRLPEPLREALFLTALEGLSAGEAGEVLGCSADAVRARTCRARTILARSLDTRRTP
ncbi:MAG: RNA polymerase sigma factor [Acidobacteriota bacterium]|nr:RNA polymerase sigma factor [Acidobacteriota bacterium]